MKTSATVEIKGKKPFLFHTFPVEALSEKKTKSGTTGNDSEEWKNTVLMDADRKLYAYDTYLLRSISEGGKEIKVGKGNLSKKVAASLEVSAVHNGKVFFEDRVCPEEPSRLDSLDVYLDIRAVVNPMTKGRNLRYRIALKPGWVLKFTIEWDDSIVSKDQMRVCVENAGLYSGIGDGRKIGFGRFDVISFEASRQAKK